MNTIYTLGYTGSTPDDVRRYAEALDAVVVDVRLSPQSRVPHWRGARLWELLGDQRYRQVPALGNVNYRDWDRPIKLFNPAAGVDQVRPLLERRAVILLCACADHRVCHRSVAADLLASKLGATVDHLPQRFADHGAASGALRGLSLTQPWASLVAFGAKTIETRSWSSPYRGEVAVHAAKGFPREAVEQTFLHPFAGVLFANGVLKPAQLPRGEIVAVARLADCIETRAVSCDGRPPHERAFGDFGPGRWAWLLADVQALRQPVPCKGALGLWPVAPEIEAAVRRQLA